MRASSHTKILMKTGVALAFALAASAAVGLSLSGAIASGSEDGPESPALSGKTAQADASGADRAGADLASLLTSTPSGSSGDTAASEEAASGPSSGSIETSVLARSESKGAIEADAIGSIVRGIYDYAAKVEYIDQYAIMPSGCEIVSLSSILQAMGCDMDAVDIYDGGYVYGDGSGDMVNSYAGDPYTSGAAMPPIMVQAGNDCLADAGIEGLVFVEATGASIDELLEYTARGLPVLVWTTMSMAEPNFLGISVGSYAWYDNEHCVVLCGETEDGLTIMDPLAGLLTRDRDAFESIYESCGSIAVVLVEDE